MGWTPDGLNVLFASDRAGSLGLWAQRTVNGKSAGAPRLVHAGLGGALSLGITTDGSLYFGVQSGDSDIEIVTIDPATGKQMSAPVRPLLGYVGMNRMPAWSPDGRYLAYVSRREVSGSSGRVIGIGDVSAGSVRELYPRLTYMERLAWAPDRLTLITDGRDLRGRSGIFSIDVRSGETTFVAEGRFPSYSSDGTHLYFVTPGSMPPNAVVERNLASGSERTIIKGELATYTLSPDGKWLAVAHGSGSVATDVVAVSVENGQAHVIYQSPANEGIPPYVGLAWTPDSHAVLMRKRVPNEELWLVPITGEPPRKVDVDIRGWAFGPVGSVSLHPDGRQLAGTRVREDRGAEVRVLENFLPALK
jgi:Tol biopolymer transport system component